MEKKINIAEILKDCPKGMELDCTMYENVYFDYVDTIGGINCYIKSNDGCLTRVRFLENGCYTTISNAKCVIYPKGKTTWEGFQRSFEDGDIVSTANGMLVGIVKRKIDDAYQTYVTVYNDANSIYTNNIFCFERFATEEEKQKLFDAIKDHGYKWNEETKTLKKLVEPKFKIGDEIVKKNGITNSYIVQSVNDEYYGLQLPDKSGVGVLPTKDQDDWELVNDNIKPKFKVGDSVRKRGDYIACTVVEIDKEYYFKVEYNEGSVSYVNIESQNDWELVPDIKPKFKIGDRIKSTISSSLYTVVDIKDETYYIKNDGEKYPYPISFSQENLYELIPNKFDITTLKPFESKVLVRDNNEQLWVADLFGFHDDRMVYKFMCVGHNVNQCIPYEGNEHLLGTTDDCDEYYKNW